VPTASKNKDRASEFIQFACSKEWMRRSVMRGNAPPRVPVLKHPDVMRDHGWAPVLAVAMQTATLEPRDAIGPTMELSLRTVISSVLSGQNTAKPALDAVASDWQRAQRRAGLKG
jgi:multiple sugar transport system substrate-binding protein